MFNDKALALWLCKKTFPQIQKVVKQVNWLLENGMCVWTHGQTQRESYTLVVVWITCMWLFLWVPLASHFDSLGSGSVFDISQDSPMCVHTSLSQNRFQQRGLWVELTSLPFWPPRSFLSERSSWLWEWEICGLLSFIRVGPSLLSCYWYFGVSFHREWSQITHSQRVHLPPASKWGLIHMSEVRVD